MSSVRVALLSGAGGGIGAAIAMELARRQYHLALTDVDEATLIATAEKARSAGARVETFSGDLTEADFPDRFVAAAAKSLGTPHLLINNAAWRELTTMRQISLASWERTLRICLTAPAFLARAAAAHMEAAGRGVIINISSIVAQRATGLAPAYAAAKGGLDSLTYELAALYGSAGIRVVAIQPGAVETELSTGIASETPSAAAPQDKTDVRRATQEMISLRRWASAEEIARVVAWAASDEASYLSGTTLTLDGGWSHELYPHPLKSSINPSQFPRDTG